MTEKEETFTVCYIAGREAAYSRTRTMLEGLKRAEFKVIACLPPDKRFRHYPGLIWRFLKIKKGCDLVVVGFYGQLLMPVVRLLTRKPVLYDLYISTYDTLVHDRSAACSGSLKARIYKFADRISMQMADRIILETRDHIRDYSAKFRIPEKKFEHLFLTVDDQVIYPKNGMEKGDRFLVHFHGEYAPFHGVRHIVQAARLLKDRDVAFQIIGTGITCEEDRKLAQHLGADNIRFIDWVPYDRLPDAMGRADCCLGIFGENPRTRRVLTNKVVETLAVGKPLITVKNQPVQELVTDGESALLVEPADPEALAEAILRLKEDPALSKQIGENGRRVFQEKCAMPIFARRLKKIAERMTAG